MNIYLTNTKTNKKELFKPIEENRVLMYTCGPTVYDKSHIGHMKAYVFADNLKRLFEFNGLKVDQVINITDVGHHTDDSDDGDDKIEVRAKKDKIDVKVLTESLTKSFKEDLVKINIDISSIRFPKATEYINEQINLLKSLEDKGYTYKTSDGIYFDTSKFEKYGELGSIDIEGLKEGARVSVNNEKKNPTDFALWKFSKEKRLQEWDSPWGIGYPGWHLECSAMAIALLGETIDIHTGGIDHIGTHHNNEIAQSESYTEKTFANYFIHSNHIMLDNQKISKSLGNTITIRDLQSKGYSPSDYRYWLLTADYKTKTNFTFEALTGSKNALDRLVNILEEKPSDKIQDDKVAEFTKIINDDLDTPKALAYIWENLKELSKETILEFDKFLGLNLKKEIQQDEIPEEIMDLAKKRQVAKKESNFSEADKLRDQILKSGFEIRDNGDDYIIKRI